MLWVMGQILQKLSELCHAEILLADGGEIAQEYMSKHVQVLPDIKSSEHVMKILW